MIILTVKHHDGFCLWHTKTTKHSVEYSPYKNDIAKEFADACRVQGMKVGFYLSPWDMNAESYGKGEEYNYFFTEQLTELLTQYGTVDEIWLDGAKDEKYHKKQEYDFKRWMDLINKLQPNCITANLGLDAKDGQEMRADMPERQNGAPKHINLQHIWMQPTMKNMDLNQHLQTLEAEKY